MITHIISVLVTNYQPHQEKKAAASENSVS